MLRDIINAPQPVPNHVYADMHLVKQTVKRQGINDQIRLVASPDGKTFNVVKGREGVIVGPYASRICGTYDIANFDEEYARLIQRGYRLAFDTPPEEIKIRTEGKYKAMPDPETDALVKYLTEVSKQAYEDYYTESVQRIAQIPKASIEEARQILLAMEAEIKSLSVSEFNQALMVIYEILPRRIDNLQKMVARRPDDFPVIVARETAAIDVMEDKIREAALTGKLGEDNRQTICEAYGLEMSPVGKGSAEYGEVMDALHGRDSGDAFDNRKDCKAIWRVENHRTRKNLEMYCQTHNIGTYDYDHGMSLLFHGSGTENLKSILQFGMMLNPNAAICGKAYGHGIYFAVSSEKSIGYTSNSGRWRTADGDMRNFLMLFDVATGKIYDVNGEQNGIPDNREELEKIHPGADCLWAFGHQGWFMHDEIVVYREDQCSIKYLIETT